MFSFFSNRALSALNNAYLGNVMGTNVVTHRDSNPSIYLHERVRVSEILLCFLSTLLSEIPLFIYK